ncbi:TetR/AcrR family transcriptional regulator [Hansschlegelia quercus]|uniref:TetR/AcrR family transcriptional regulator n=1 Tax=Hansschlegelia quercus TaxID=2528245 RepID=A0A4Q9GD52_9HYPH|nr:TetR family transcriptional regulator [Hansschlegelia quercus]TBN47582.1 TetR/AcrR family transcriptional regulator [Hansschlegelia quercus]
MARQSGIRRAAPQSNARPAHAARSLDASTKGVARRRLAPAERTELILDGALKLFAERHYSTVTVRDLGLACGVNPALIYYYFESKEHLFAQALGHAIGQLNAGYAEASSGGDARSQIMAWLDMHASIAPTLVRMTKLMSDYAPSRRSEDAAAALIAQFYAREQALLEDCIGRGIAAGQFRAVDVTKTARAISLHLDGIFFASTARGDDRIAADIEDLRGLVAELLDKSVA